MIPKLALLILVPTTAVLVTLALGERSQRADFVVVTLEPRTLDPQRLSWLHEIQLAAALFEGLTRLNAATFVPEAAVAEQWEVSPDRREFTFHLRPTARWSNGEPVTAEHFRFAWLRALDPKAEAAYANLFFVIDGAEAYYRSRLEDATTSALPAETVGIAVLGPHTLRITLTAPCAYFLDLTSFIAFVPLHPPTLERWAYRDGQVLRGTQHLWLRPENIVCNGAFVLHDWAFKERVWLERNPHYWDTDTIAVDTIEGTIMGDMNAALIAYRTGRVDFVRGVERTVAQALLAEQAAGRRSDFRTGERFASFFFRVNTKRPPFDNVELRKALSLALDRDAICAHVMGLGEQPAYSFVPRAAIPLMERSGPDGGVIHYTPPEGLGAGLTQAEREVLAREHLARSGLGMAVARRPIELAFAGGDAEQRLIAEAVQSMWERVLGVRVSLLQMEGKVLTTKLRNLDYDVARATWFGDYMDPSTFLELFTTHNGTNLTGWSFVAYDELIAAAAVEGDNLERFRLLAAAERILVEDALPILPLFFRQGNYLLQPRFEGVNDNVRDLLQIHRVRPVTRED
ncbi:MAG: peptide ABC transporter substrate-binding protein [Phycisphaerales bacterium]|nr:peptide ABC transporter substrate-binding protein [Phycisphaerales bacterium]